MRSRVRTFAAVQRILDDTLNPTVDRADLPRRPLAARIVEAYESVPDPVEKAARAWQAARAADDAGALKRAEERLLAVLWHPADKRCPDDGACHHNCGASCWRVGACAPLSASGWEDWPAEIKLRHLSKPTGPPSGEENGVPYDAWCIECKDTGKWQRVKHRLGAWWCPTHHDRGHVEFVAHEA